VAYHGSSNRTEPTGGKVVRYKLDAAGNFMDVEDFITGWLTPAGALGRPVDILITPDGVIYISDDKAGVVYRVVYQNM
jgi:glucose/arabinose dehydrogenase